MSMPSELKVMCSFAWNALTLWHGWRIAAQSLFSMLESHINHAIATLKFVLESCAKICLLLSLDCNFLKFYSKNNCRFTEICKSGVSIIASFTLHPHESMLNRWLTQFENQNYSMYVCIFVIFVMCADSCNSYLSVIKKTALTLSLLLTSFHNFHLLIRDCPIKLITVCNIWRLAL